MRFRRISTTRRPSRPPQSPHVRVSRARCRRAAQHARPGRNNDNAHPPIYPRSSRPTPTVRAGAGGIEPRQGVRVRVSAFLALSAPRWRTRRRWRSRWAGSVPRDGDHDQGAQLPGRVWARPGERTEARTELRRGVATVYRRPRRSGSAPDLRLDQDRRRRRRCSRRWTSCRRWRATRSARTPRRRRTSRKWWASADTP